MTANCLLIDSRERDLPTVALEVACRRGLRVERLPFASDAALPDRAAAGSLIAFTFDRFRHLSPTAQSNLTAYVARCATLHLKVAAGPGRPCTLAPFADGQFLVSRTTLTTGYRLTDHSMLPAPLRGEEWMGAFTTPVALGLPLAAQPLLLARGVDGLERPAIFAVRTGSGTVIYDLQADTGAEMATLAMLEDPASLPKAIGALAASRAAWELEIPPSYFNLVIDDRPANFDYFNCSRMLGFLRHLEHRFPGVHVDFAWTPDQTRPSPRYVAAMKSFHAGFVWHGLLRHVDHRPIADLAAEFAGGQRLVEQVSAAYGVRFQPVMIFPFERDTPRCVEFLEDHGFIAKTHTPPDPEADADASDAVVPAATRQPAPGPAPERFIVLERFPVERLTRSRMLARAVLGLPIIAAAHPPDIGLVRLASLRPRARGSFDHFDPVLRFAAEKHLHPASLEEIAQRAMVRGSL